MKIAGILSLCALMGVGACHQDSGTSAQAALKPRPSLPAPVKKGPTAAELTAGMVEAAPQGKSPLAVDLKFDLKQRPTLGQPLDIDIAVVPQIDSNGAQIQVNSGDGLTVLPGTSPIDLPAVTAGQVYRQIVKVTPTLDGVLVLGLTVSLKHDEMTESRAFSIPLIVQR